MDIDSSGFNKNEYVYQSIFDAIRDGSIPGGTRLPSERELSEQYSCSRITIRRALDRLDRNDVIRRMHGSGTFVNWRGGNPSSDFRVGLVLNTEGEELSSDPYLSELLYGIVAAGAKNPFTISIIPVAAGENLTSTLRKRGQSLNNYNGFVIPRDLSELEVNILSASGLPFVLLQNEQIKEYHSYVSIDNVKGAYLAAMHLLEIGCRNLFFVSPEKLPQLADRVKGFRRALREFGLPDEPGDFLLTVGEDDYTGAEQAIERMIAENRKFDGFLLGSDGCTYSVVTTLRKHAIRIPEEVSVIMWDDFPWVSKVLRLPLTVVCQPFREQVRSAIEILMRQKNQMRVSNIQKIIQPSLLVRCSCRTPNQY